MAIFHGTSIPAGASGGSFADGTTLRLNHEESPFLSRTQVAGNRKTWTMSFWVKRTKLSYNYDSLVGTGDPSGHHQLCFQSDDTLRWYESGGDLVTAAKYRDVSNWYHIVARYDSTQASGTLRQRLYVNGEEITSFTTDSHVSQNADSRIGNTEEFRIGKISSTNGGSPSWYGACYINSFYLIDGQSLGPENFGETGTYGEWKPIEYTGTYGNNGTYVPFNNTATHKSINSVNQTHHDTAEYKWGGSSIRMDGSSDFLELTNADSALFQPFNDTTTTWTFDAWVKFASYAGTQWYISHGTGTTDRWGFYHIGDGTTGHYTILSNGSGTQFNGNGTGNGGLITDNDWHHVMWIKKANEVAMYVDGTQCGYIQNTQTDYTGGQLYIGAKYDGSEAFNGWMDDIRVYKGNPFDASPNTGNTDTITVPTGAHTSDANTILLVQSDHSDGSTNITDSAGSAAGLGTDTSGNNNNFTLNNVNIYDQVLDSPANNYCTLNPLDESPHNKGTFSEGNLKYVGNPSGYDSGGKVATLYTTEKFYFEIYCGAGNPWHRFGIAPDDYHPSVVPSGISTQEYPGLTNGGRVNNGLIVKYDANLIYYDSTSTVSITSTDPVAGVILMCAFDPSTGKFWWGQNGTWENSGNPSAGTNPSVTLSNLTKNGRPYSWTGWYGNYHNSHTGVVNYGQDSTFGGYTSAGGNADVNGYGNFKYPVPTDFLTLCSANLPDPAVKPSEHFSTTVRSGNNNQAVTGIGFQPDLVWNKTRNEAHHHQLHDSVRGATDGMLNTNRGPGVDNTYQFDSFDSDGFTVDSGNLAGINDSSYNYVTWAWKANGAGSSNTDGSINTTATSANVDAGFSISTYTGTGASATIGHGLSKAPDMVIIARRDGGIGSHEWIIGHQQLETNAFGNNKFLKLPTPGTVYSNGLVWGSQPTSSVIQLTTGSAGNLNASGGTYVAYCFHSVEGYSKFGRYDATYNSDGPFIHTGFRPAFLMLKAYNGAGWFCLYDTARSSYNPTDHLLAANNANTEKGPGEDTFKLDIVSNGFKLREQDSYSNASSGQYIYMAFAEQPFKYSNAR